MEALPKRKEKRKRQVEVGWKLVGTWRCGLDSEEEMEEEG